MLPAVAYTLLGTSRQLIVGPEAALAVLVASFVIPGMQEDAAAAFGQLLATHSRERVAHDVAA